jgi:hypothetical protein
MSVSELVIDISTTTDSATTSGADTSATTYPQGA